jgi:hypothetical protein
MNATTRPVIDGILDAPLHPWRPLFWEPVSGTGERLLVGVVHGYEGHWGTARMLRDESLDCLFGKRSQGARRLIEHGLALFRAAAAAGGSLQFLSEPLMGIYPGELRNTAARSLQELLRTAALLHSSLANLDKLDELEEVDAPLPEEVNRRFSTEVKDIALAMRPDLLNYFGTSTELVPGGQRVKFGFCSPRVVAHFNVLYPVRPSASLRDARARLFELQQAQALANIQLGALIGAVVRDDDATLSDRQRQQLSEARSEIASEASAAGLSYYPVTTAQQGAERIVELAA